MFNQKAIQFLISNELQPAPESSAASAQCTEPQPPVSVITKFAGLIFTFSDGQGGKDLQQNDTGIATGAVLAMSE